MRDSEFLELNNEFHSPGFQIPPAKISRIPESLTWGDHKKQPVKAGYHDLNSSYTMFSAPWQSLPLLPF